MNATDFSYKDFLALILIYTANASEGIQMEEHDFILAKVGEEHYEKAIEFFDTSSEVEIIETIDELADKYARDQREKVFADVADLIQVDDADQSIEEQILRMLKRLI